MPLLSSSSGPRGRFDSVPLLLLALVADGFDTAAFAFVIPTLSRAWGLHPAAFTLPLVIANFGAVVGFFCCGWLSSRIGRHTVVSASVALFSVGTLLLPLSPSIAVMSALRLLIGFGFGAVIPAAVSLASDVVPPRLRASVSVAVLIGLSVGFTLGGLVGGRLLTRFGWHGVFWLPGAFFAVCAVLMWWRLPRISPAEPGQAATASLRSLFAAGLRSRTIMLGLFAFIVFAAYYTLQSWLPTLLVSTGFTTTQAPLAAAALGIGGIVGGILLALGSAYVRPARLLIVVSLLAVGCLVVAGLVPVRLAVLLTVLGGAGAGLLASCNGSAAIAVGVYDGATRTTGVAWTAGIGRVGSIVGPAAGGLLVALDQGVPVLVLGLVAPLLLAAGIAIALARRTRAAERKPLGARQDPHGRAAGTKLSTKE
ncbi:MFS transporter [Amycolatopsis pithecellobii]|nr:MFS transporter [Amycolatopsis pithecellobii]